MQRRCLLLALAFAYVCVAHVVALQTDIHRLLNSFPSRDLPKLTSFSSKNTANEASHSYGFGHSRKLEQSEASVCFWDMSEDECFMGVDGREYFLTQADNVVASYLLRSLQCDGGQFQEQCEDLECVWVENTGCYVRHEEVRDFYDVECMDDVRHLVDALAGNHECLPIDTELGCSGADRCYWNDGECSFDRSKFYHGIPSAEGNLPESFGEVIAARNLQLTNDIQDATENGDIETSADLPDWDPPPFNCPVIYEDVVCDYVDALTPILILNLYCNTQYQSATDIIDCNNDDLCEADTNDPTNICGPSTSALIPAYRDASLVFADSIEDPEARRYETKRTECVFIAEEEDCDGDCTWDDGACVLSEQWAEEDVYRLVGDTDDPVCEYYVLPAKSGCYDHERESECTGDPACFYRPETDECVINFGEVVAYALNLSGVLEAYEATIAECEEQENEDDCDSVEPAELESESDESEGGRGSGGRGGRGRRNEETEEGDTEEDGETEETREDRETPDEEEETRETPDEEEETRETPDEEEETRETPDEEEEDSPVALGTLTADPGDLSDEAAASSIAAEDETIEDIESSLPTSIEPEVDAEASIEAMAPSASSAVDDEIGRVQGLGGILGFGR